MLGARRGNSRIDPGIKILHVTPSFYPAQAYGGPTESVFQLCVHLARSGCQVRVLTTDADGLDRVVDVDVSREVEAEEGVHVRYCRRLLRHSVSPSLLRQLPPHVRWADVVHVTAVYSFPVIPTLLACRVFGRAAVWSPRGALQRWAGSRRRPLKAGWERVCRLVAPRRVVLHVTSEQEEKESADRLPGVETAVVPNGIQVPEEITRTDGEGPLRLVYLGRLDPIKGIENLLRACRRLTRDMKPWRLTIAGYGDERYQRRLGTLVDELALQSRVTMIGAVVGESKRRLFEDSDVAVVPSHSENFGIVVAEALAHGVPVIASRGTPWKRLEEMGCGLWVDNTPEELARAIDAMSTMPLAEMGERGRDWMKREFSWSERASEMRMLYARLLT